MEAELVVIPVVILLISSNQFFRRSAQVGFQVEELLAGLDRTGGSGSLMREKERISNLSSISLWKKLLMVVRKLSSFLVPRSAADS